MLLNTTILKTIALIISIAFSQFSIAQVLPPTQNISSQITALTVFLNNAEVLRQVSVRIPKGKSDVVFDNLSSKILDKGIKITSSNNVKVYAVALEKDTKSYKTDEAYKKIVDSLAQIQKKKDVHLINLETLKKEMLFLESNMKVNSNSAIDFSQIDEAEKYFSKKIRLLQEKIVEETYQLEKMTALYNDVIKSKNELIVKLFKTNGKIRVTFLSDIDTDCDIELRYLVSNAVWKPIYAIRAVEGSNQVTFEYQTQIYNDTGVDWNNKPITLAILDSSDDIDKPELDIWTLEEDKNQKSKRRFSNAHRSGRAKNSLRDVDSSEEQFDVLEVDDLSTRFELKGLHRIPSDASPHLIDVHTYQKEVDFYNLSIPKVKNGAFLIARIKDWENLGLLDGTVNLYYNDSYQGFSHLETQQLNDTLDVSLGRENSYTVSRKKLSSKSKKKLIGFNIREILTYEIVVRNNKNEAGEIQIKDQMPISTSKDVEIKPLSLNNGKVDPVTGEVIWNLKLPANETKKLILKFEIKYPKNKRDQIKYSTKIITTPRYF